MHFLNAAENLIKMTAFCASSCHASGAINGFRCEQGFNDPGTKTTMFTASRLGAAAR